MVRGESIRALLALATQEDMHLHQTSSDPCLYVSITDSTLIVAVYVDDLIQEDQLDEQSLSNRFKMQDLGKLHHFLGIRVLVEGRV